MRSAVEAGLGGRTGRKQLLDDETFPTSACNRMGQHRLNIAEPEQRMNDTAVTYVDFGRAHQSLADIAMPGR